MKTARNYKDESQKLANAIDIAIEIYKEYRPFNLTDSQISMIVDGLNHQKTLILNPEPKFRNLTSLKYSIEYVFTAFHEGAGEGVEYFWKRLSDAGLQYEREDKLAKILQRGSIRNRIEYELTVDSLVIARQEKRISENDMQRLSKMIENYELKQAKRRII